MVGAKETVTDPNHIVAAIVLVVAYEDVELIVQGDFVDISQPSGEYMEVPSVQAATKYSAAAIVEAIPFRAVDDTAPIAKSQVQPTVVTDRNTIGAMQEIRVVFGSQP